MQVAELVGFPGADQGVVGRQGVLQHISAAIDFAVFLALGQFGADRCGGVEPADAGRGDADALRQRALRHQFGVHQPLVVHPHKGADNRGMRRRGESANHFLDLPRLHQCADVHQFVGSAGVVGDAGKLPGALPVKGGQQVAGNAHAGKAGTHNNGAVGDAGHCGVHSGVHLVFHKRAFVRIGIGGRLQRFYGRQGKILAQTGRLRHRAEAAAAAPTPAARRRGCSRRFRGSARRGNPPVRSGCQGSSRRTGKPRRYCIRGPESKRSRPPE